MGVERVIPRVQLPVFFRHCWILRHLLKAPGNRDYFCGVGGRGICSGRIAGICEKYHCGDLAIVGEPTGLSGLFPQRFVDPIGKTGKAAHGSTPEKGIMPLKKCNKHEPPA